MNTIFSAPHLSINTDVSLIQADWQHFAEYHQRHYGLAIEYLKSSIQKANPRYYRNNVMEVAVSEVGFYSQAVHFPAAFYGDTVPVELEPIQANQIDALAWEAVTLYRNGDVQSLTAIYSEYDRSDVFFGYRVQQMDKKELYELGSLRNAQPVHLRVIIDCQQENDVFGLQQGTLIYQRTSEGQHILLRAPAPISTSQAMPQTMPLNLLQGFRD